MLVKSKWDAYESSCEKCGANNAGEIDVLSCNRCVCLCHTNQSTYINISISAKPMSFPLYIHNQLFITIGLEKNSFKNKPSNIYKYLRFYTECVTDLDNEAK